MPDERFGPGGRANPPFPQQAKASPMAVCPHCRQPIAEQPQTTPASTILLWGGVGLATGCVLTFLGMLVIGFAIMNTGQKANQTFLTVGSSLTTSGGR